MDVGGANEVQRESDKNRLRVAYEVDRALVRVVVASCFQRGGCVLEEAWQNRDEHDIELDRDLGQTSILRFVVDERVSHR
jgi:hypothetical protein